MRQFSGSDQKTFVQAVDFKCQLLLAFSIFDLENSHTHVPVLVEHEKKVFVISQATGADSSEALHCVVEQDT